MTEQPPKAENPGVESEASLTVQQPSTTVDADDELRALYIQQQQRMSCPGCGEGHQIF